MKIRIAAKTDMGLVRQNNEDNFQAASDLNDSQMRWVNNATVDLGPKGALIVVADGMGGMNAGEVASEIAINTVREWFKSENLTADVMETRFSIEKFMNEAVIKADANIKEHAKEHPESRGMGTTIVIGWILNGTLYVSWCGDSRAYVYNPATGLHQISKDHSYVQGLVDKGQISREDAFDFPGSNIITRSLCDGGPKARPESLLKPYPLADGDVVMLCTDGLCGMIRDNEIEAVMGANLNDTTAMVDQLIKAACDAEGSDNITICLCQIMEGGAPLQPAYFEDTEKRLNGKAKNNGLLNTLAPGENGGGKNNGNTKKWIIIILAAVLTLCIGIICWLLIDRSDSGDEEETPQNTEEVVIKEEEPKENAEDNSASETPTQTAQEPKVNKDKPKEDKSSLINLISTGKDADPKDDKSNTMGDKDGDSDLTPIPSSDNTNAQAPDNDQINSNSLDNNSIDVSKPLATKKYTVKKGDTAYKISIDLGLKGNTEVLKNLNPEVDLDRLKEGQEINIPNLN